MCMWYSSCVPHTHVCFALCVVQYVWLNFRPLFFWDLKGSPPPPPITLISPSVSPGVSPEMAKGFFPNSSAESTCYDYEVVLVLQNKFKWLTATKNSKTSGIFHNKKILFPVSTKRSALDLFCFPIKHSTPTPGKFFNTRARLEHRSWSQEIKKQENCVLPTVHSILLEDTAPLLHFRKREYDPRFVIGTAVINTQPRWWPWLCACL